MARSRDDAAADPVLAQFLAVADRASGGRRPSRSRPTPDDVEAIRAERHATRAAERGGGMCHLVTEWCADTFGWPRAAVTYLADTGEVAVTGHFVNVLPDGALVDPTADQFGQDDDVRVVEPHEPAYRDYRLEWDLDHNPGTDPSCAAVAAALGVAWTGEDDSRARARLERDRGQLWWWNPAHADHMRRYLDSQAAHSAGTAYSRFVAAKAAALEDRIREGAPAPPGP